MFFCKTISLFFYLLSFIVVRRKNLWAFGSETGFDGNTKYFMIDVFEHHKEIRPVWITKRKKEVDFVRKKGLEAYYSFSLKGLCLSLLASKYVVSGSLADINFYTSGGAKYVQLWHGIGIKCCLWNNKNSIYRTNNKFIGFIKRPSFYLEPDYIMGASKMMNGVLASMFRAKVSKCHSTLYPRCDLFFRTLNEVERHIDAWENAEMRSFVDKMKMYNKVYLYMPTYRDKDPFFLENQHWDMEMLNLTLSKKNALLIVKLHPHMVCGIDFGKYSNVVELNKKLDMYPILPFTHTLITDYSSVYYDYILMEKKEIILYVPDLDDYIKRSRDLLMDYQENTAGTFVESFEDLLNCFGQNNAVDYSYIRTRFWGNAMKNRLPLLFEEIDGLE